jgi:DsbC/DsbD-like thiol-disulfide interchange protein
MKILTMGLLSLALLLSVFTAKAQILKPVHWSYAAKRTGKAGAVVFIKATIEDGWHIYSQHVKDGGPVATSFSFTPDAAYLPLGKTAEPKPIARFEKAFGMQVSYFEKSVIFQQRVNLKKDKVTVKGQFEYMTCNDKQCLPPETVAFSIPVH